MFQIPADLPAPLVPLAFLLGTWVGVGVGDYPTIEAFRFGQEITFGHSGQPVLTYTSRTWLLDENGRQVRPLASETGYWRPVGPDQGRVEVVLAHPTGIAEIWVGEVTGAKIELSTDVVARTESAKPVTAGHRLYGVVEGELMYAYDMAAMGQPLSPHVSARLKSMPPSQQAGASAPAGPADDAEHA